MKLNEFSKVAAIGAMAVGLNGCGDDQWYLGENCGAGTANQTMTPEQTRNDYCYEMGEVNPAVANCEKKNCTCDSCGTCEHEKVEITCSQIRSLTQSQFEDVYSSCTVNGRDECDPALMK